MSEELITNGDFETGDFTGWIVNDVFGSPAPGDMWYINDGNVEIPYSLSDDTTDTFYASDPISGDYDAISDYTVLAQSVGPFSLLIQNFTLPSNISSATLSWKDRICNYAGDFSAPDNINMGEWQTLNVGFVDMGAVFCTLPGDDVMQEGPNLRSIDVTEILKSSTTPEVGLIFWVAAAVEPLFVTVDDISLEVYTLDDMAIDIKPGSDPNCFNNDGHGVIPVAILGSAGFDVTTIDAGSVMLEGLAIKAVGKSNKLLAHYDDVNNDGYYDLVVQIEDTDQVFAEGDTIATVTGYLNDDTYFQGSDSICIVPLVCDDGGRSEG